MWSGPQQIWQPVNILDELLDRIEVRLYGLRRVVAALNLIQHHLAKIGPSELSCASAVSERQG
jgi:hypothetical protein